MSALEQSDRPPGIPLWVDCYGKCGPVAVIGERLVSGNQSWAKTGHQSSPYKDSVAVVADIHLASPVIASNDALGATCGNFPYVGVDHGCADIAVLQELLRSSNGKPSRAPKALFVQPTGSLLLRHTGSRKPLTPSPHITHHAGPQWTIQASLSDLCLGICAQPDLKGGY